MGNAVVHFEIMGTDGPALEKFYGELFSWKVQSMPEMDYGIIDTQGGTGINGGIGTSRVGKGAVLFYIAVEDPQAALDRVEAAGGSITAPVVEVPGVVTFAQFADPEGNVVGVVKSSEPGDQGATGPSAGSGAPVTWFEIVGRDVDALAAFYAGLFGWTQQAPPVEATPYVHMDTGAGAGIQGGIGLAHDGNPAVHVYAAVPDLQQCCDHADSLGGSVAMAPMKLGDGLEFAHIGDPQGNAFGIYRMPGGS